MKIIYIIIVAILSLNIAGAQNSNLEKWEKANNAYINSEYTRAIQLYEEILSEGDQSAKLFFNLGNGYFKQNMLGKAILNYNRAAMLDPSDEDIQYNLSLTTARTVDKIEAVPEFFLKTWLRKLGNIMSSNAWAISALILFGITLASIILWLISNAIQLRKLGFYTGFISFAICIVSLIYSHGAYSTANNGNLAVVMNTAAPVKSSPAASSKDLFVLHEGTKVSVGEFIDGWCEIRLEDGNKGWITEGAIEKI